MAYQRTYWVNDETVVDADRMNNIENGISTLDSTLTNDVYTKEQTNTQIANAFKTNVSIDGKLTAKNGLNVSAGEIVVSQGNITAKKTNDSPCQISSYANAGNVVLYAGEDNTKYVGIRGKSTETTSSKWLISMAQNGSITVNGDNTTTTVINGAKVRVASTNPSTVLTVNSNREITSSAVTPTELGYLDGVTSNIQTQINAINNKTKIFNRAMTDITSLATGTIGSCGSLQLSAGNYIVRFSVRFAANSTGGRELSISNTTTNLLGLGLWETHATSPSGTVSLGIVGMLNLTSATTVHFLVRQTSGGALNVTVPRVSVIEV